MMSVWDKILVKYHISDKILLQKQNSKQNFDLETRVRVDNEIKILLWYQNSEKVLLQKQNSKQNFDFETSVGVDNETKFCYNIKIPTKFCCKNKILRRISISREG